MLLNKDVVKFHIEKRNINCNKLHVYEFFENIKLVKN